MSRRNLFFIPHKDPESIYTFYKLKYMYLKESTRFLSSVVLRRCVSLLSGLIVEEFSFGSVPGVSCLIVVFGFLLNELESTRTLHAHRSVAFEGEAAFPLEISGYVTSDQLLRSYHPFV